MSQINVVSKTIASQVTLPTGTLSADSCHPIKIPNDKAFVNAAQH
jgi:hypothetical protein